MATPRPPSKLLDLEITIVSAKHLKNVNWRHGDLKPYAIFWVDPDRRLATKSDDSGSTHPVWNERFIIPVPTLSPAEAILTLEIFHSKPHETPKPLVGTLRFPLKDLIDSDDSAQLRNFELRRPSGRPQGKIRLKLALRERPSPDYPIAPQPNYYYSSAPPPPPRYSSSSYTAHTPPPPPAAPPSPSLPPPPPPHSYSYGSYSDSYSGYYPGYYAQQHPPPPPRPFFYGGPSAPVDYALYEQKPRSAKMGMGTGLAVGAVAGTLAGVALDEGLKYDEERIADRGDESDVSARGDYSDYRVDY